MTTPEPGLTTGRNVGYQTGVRNMRHLILATSIATSMLLYAAVPAHAQVSVGIQSHGVSIGFNVSAYPRMVAIPGYPVYYDPRMSSNYFFYDGLYWVYQDNNWYSSGWYDGPWDQIGPQYVPAFVLRVPVRYYGQRPAYFAGWSVDVAPHWGEYWGNDWQQQRSGWDSWDRQSVYQAAPLPAYQAQYSGSRYPRAVDQQYSIQATNYRYQPREAVAQQYYQQHVVTSATRNATTQQVQSPQQSGAQQQQRSRNQTQQQSNAQQQRQEHAKDQAQQQSHGQQQQKQQQQHAQQQQAPQQGPSNQHQPRQQAVAKDKKSSQSDNDKGLSLIHISEPTRLLSISYAVF